MQDKLSELINLLDRAYATENYAFQFLDVECVILIYSRDLNSYNSWMKSFIVTLTKLNHVIYISSNWAYWAPQKDFTDFEALLKLGSKWSRLSPINHVWAFHLSGWVVSALLHSMLNGLLLSGSEKWRVQFFYVFITIYYFFAHEYTRKNRQ